MWSNTTITAIYTQEFPYLAVHSNNVIGLFYDSFKLVKEKLQFEVTLMENSQEDNFNSTLDQLKKRNATLALNFHQAMTRDFLNFDLLPINIFFNYFWVVPQARRLRSWDTFYRNFDRPTWLLVLLLLTILSVAKYYLRERDLVLAFLSYYQILLENSNLRTVQIKKTKIRMVISVSLLSFLVLSTSFKTAMVSSFTKRRYEHQISSLEDIVNLNLKCYATEEIKSSYGMSEDYLSGYVANCTTINKKNKEDILMEIALKRSAAMTCRGFEFKFMLEKLYLMGYEKRLIALVPKKVSSDNAFMYFTKGHPLYDRFFTIAGRISNSGISNFLSPFTTWPIRYLCGRLVFLFMWCGGAPGYFPRPPTPTISSPFSFFWTTQHEYNNTQHPWEAHPAWDSNPADLAVVSEECRSSFHHPTVNP
uniref:Uncharacterized protein n=1 Tax=Tenebrio molitor TaxID=7067 RepID=A0A8J6L5Y7_TENMO|nr:hypothetical protein GEV33_015289 [Tenebrio molitor]